MVENFLAFLESVLATPYVKGFVMLFFFVIGVTTAIVPESLVRILPQLKGHYYKRIAFAIGLAFSIITVGVLASWFLGPTFLGWWGYLLGAIALVLGALQAFELIAFIHPSLERPEEEKAPIIRGKRDNALRLRKKNIARLKMLLKTGLRTGFVWGSDRFAIYVWLVVSIAMVGWRLAAMMIISFIVGNIAMTIWTGRRFERIAKIATRPYYRKLMLIFRHFMGFLMIAEAIYLFKVII